MLSVSCLDIFVSFLPTIITTAVAPQTIWPIFPITVWSRTRLRLNYYLLHCYPIVNFKTIYDLMILLHLFSIFTSFFNKFICHINSWQKKTIFIMLLHKMWLVMLFSMILYTLLIFILPCLFSIRCGAPLLSLQTILTTVSDDGSS